MIGRLRIYGLPLPIAPSWNWNDYRPPKEAKEHGLPIAPSWNWNTHPAWCWSNRPTLPIAPSWNWNLSKRWPPGSRGRLPIAPSWNWNDGKTVLLASDTSDSQSHQAGIETFFSLINSASPASSQSHQAGIETIRAWCYRQWGLTPPNRTKLELKHFYDLLNRPK